MAETRTIEVPEMADATVPDETELRFRVMPRSRVKQDIDEGNEKAEATNKTALKVGDRLYVETRFQAQNVSNRAQVERRNRPFRQLNRRNYPSLTLTELRGFRKVLKKIHDQDRADLGLEPNP